MASDEKKKKLEELLFSDKLKRDAYERLGNITVLKTENLPLKALCYYSEARDCYLMGLNYGANVLVRCILDMIIRDASGRINEKQSKLSKWIGETGWKKEHKEMAGKLLEDTHIFVHYTPEKTDKKVEGTQTVALLKNVYQTNSTMSNIMRMRSGCIETVKGICPKDIWFDGGLVDLTVNNFNKLTVLLNELFPKKRNYGDR